jgi:hypothetical protein
MPLTAVAPHYCRGFAGGYRPTLMSVLLAGTA